jgi:hypothetical protein
MILALVALSIYQIVRDRVDLPVPLVWVNFSIATLLRIAIVGLKVSFEYIVRRIQIHTVYILTALSSFVYSAHVLGSSSTMSYVVLFVDIGFILISVLPLVLIKCLTKRNHGLLIKIKESLRCILITLAVLYGLFITALAIANTVLRYKEIPNYVAVLFFFECAHLIVYSLLYLISKNS